jgi:hypothetical protein
VVCIHASRWYPSTDSLVFIDYHDWCSCSFTPPITATWHHVSRYIRPLCLG